jgi:hypothetical protein
MLGTAFMAYAQTAPFTLTLGAARYEVKVGDPVDISVVMTNTSDHDVDCTTVSSNALDRSYEYDVRNEQGQRVKKIEKEHHGGSSIWPCVLKPGQTDTPSGGRISVLYDFSRPGKYTIQVFRSVFGDQGRPRTFGKGSDHAPVVASNTITVTVNRAEVGPGK